MGKTSNIFTGIVRKKIGNLVGYRITDSNNKEKQGLRAYNATVSNPQSYLQAKQRAKLAPALSFYKAFVGALNHAFIPDGKATANRAEFMSYAMSLDQVPHLKKGESGLPILPYRIAKGRNGLDEYCVCPFSDGLIVDSSLPSAAQDALMSRFAAFTLLGMGDPVAMQNHTLADYSNYLLRNGDGFQDGDQISFLVLLDHNAAIVPVKIEFVLDTTDTVNLMNDLIAFRSGNKIWYVEGGESYFYLESANDYKVVAAGCIITRNNGSTFVYTNSWMYVTAYGKTQWAYSEQEVIESYMSQASLKSSDRYLQQAVNVVSDDTGVYIQSRDETAITLASGVSGTLSSEDAAVVVLSNGIRKLVCIDGSPTTYNSSTNQYTKITLTPSGGQAAPLMLAQTTFGANAAYITPSDVIIG